MPKGRCLNTGRTHFKKGIHPKTQFKKGHISWNKNKKLPPETDIHKRNISEGVKKHLPKTAFKKGSVSWNKDKKMPMISKSKHWHWKNGQYKSRKYMLILKPEHPFCDSKGYVRRSHLVMEKHLGRYLLPKEVVHHKGIKYPIGSIENKSDDRLVNLKLFKNHSKHMKFHH